MRTDQEQLQLIADNKEQLIQQLEQDNAENEEYFTRVFHWKIDFKGRIYATPSFNPNHYIGTQAEYNNIWVNELRGKEDEFKIIGENKFDSSEELEKVYPIKKFQTDKTRVENINLK